MDRLFTNYQFEPYSFALIFTTLLGLLVALAAWRRRPALGAGYLAILELAVTEWVAATIFEAAATTVQLKIFWSVVSYPGTAFGPLLYFLFAMEYGRQSKYLTRRNIALLSILPALTVILAATNNWHHWLWTEVRISSTHHIGLYGHGLWFWVFVAYSYALLFIGLLALYRSIFRYPAFYKSQISILLIGSVLPIAGNIMYVFGLNPVPGLDWTPIAFVLTGAFMGWGIFQFQIFDLVPVARTQLIESMPDGVVVLDTQNRIVDINPSALTLLENSSPKLIGQPIQNMLKTWPDLIRNGNRTLALPDEEIEVDRYIDVQISPLHDPQSRFMGRVVVLRDITQRKQVEEELRQANERLRDQLIEIERLQAKLREEVIRDPLTGVFNRRYLEETLERELAEAQREEQPLSLVMMDIDNFKQFNDAYGHQAGDLMLQSLAKLVGRRIRKGDVLCRYGGEEFIVVLANTSLEIAYRRAEEWRSAFNALEVTYSVMTLKSTISLGVASYPGHGASYEALLTAADQAMYLAKDSGRNCTISWQPA